MLKSLLLLLPLGIFLSQPAFAADREYCVSCGTSGQFHCTFSSKTSFGLKPGRFFCETLLSKMVKGPCHSSAYRFLQCGFKPQVIIQAGGFSEKERKTLKLTDLRSLLYFTAKGMVNLLELTYRGEEKAKAALSPALHKAGDFVQQPLKRAGERLIKKGSDAFDQASKKVKKVRDSAQEKLAKVRKKAKKQFKQAKNSAQERIDQMKKRAHLLGK